MEFKEVKAQTVFYETMTTTLNAIGQYVGTTPQRLMSEAVEAGFELAGPQIWIYEGATGQPDVSFQLTIAIPVQGGPQQHEQIKQLNAFTCAEHILEGNWDQFKTIYPELIGNLMGQKMQLTGICREVYHQVDFEHPENNRTAIQIGIINN